MEQIDPRVDMVLQSESAHDPGTGPAYEATEVKIRGFLTSGFIMTLVILIVMAILGGWYAILASRERAILDRRPPRFADDHDQFPPPNLQGSPSADMAAMREVEATRLESYGWVDEEASIAHIPIRRAMELTLPALNQPAREASTSKSTSPRSLPVEAPSRSGANADTSPAVSAPQPAGDRPEASPRSEPGRSPD